MDGAGPRDVGRRIGSGLFLASPAFAALAMYWLADAHVAVVAVIAVAAVTLRPIHTGPIVRTAVVVFALSPATAMIVSFSGWIADTVTGIWASIGTFHVLIRFPAYAAFALAVAVVALVFQAVGGALVAQPLCNIIERENRARQRRRDAAAASIVAALPSGLRAPFSLYLRPFDTTAQLSSNLIGASVTGPGGTGPGGNIQTDFEAILASAFPAHRPLIALGTPGALLPTKPQNGWTQLGIDLTWDIPGSGKWASAEEDWRDTVALLARNAELILIVPLQFTGTLWEIEYVCTHDLL